MILIKNTKIQKNNYNKNKEKIKFKFNFKELNERVKVLSKKKKMFGCI